MPSCLSIIDPFVALMFRPDAPAINGLALTCVVHVTLAKEASKIMKERIVLL
ncbi:hypothetical protein EJ08DRAFT_653561 [Tothia fuscella]|uniref:Uncharacterized protein n=1 Tax=Tothia fuscella TaxID=1048955 RepID=A0A9P4NH17_9PEZI|nr:hypothetical protein EJ08DRAFT_653561 [Tothia fuscella]